MTNENLDEETGLLRRATTALLETPIPAGPPEAVVRRVTEPGRHRWMRYPGRPPIVHPMVRRAAAGVAAVLVLGAVGYVAGTALQRGGLPLPTEKMFAKVQVFQTQQYQEETVGAGVSISNISSSSRWMAPRNPEAAAEANQRDGRTVASVFDYDTGVTKSQNELAGREGHIAQLAKTIEGSVTPYYGLAVGDTATSPEAMAEQANRQVAGANARFEAGRRDVAAVTTEDFRHTAAGKPNFILVSAGPDRIYGTADDITKLGGTDVGPPDGSASTKQPGPRAVAVARNPENAAQGNWDERAHDVKEDRWSGKSSEGAGSALFKGGDGHVEFLPKSFVGANADNIYTDKEPRQGAGQSSAAANSKDDSVLLPTQNSDGDGIADAQVVNGAVRVEDRSFKPGQLASAAAPGNGNIAVSTGQTLTANGVVNGSGALVVGDTTNAGTVVLGGTSGGTLVVGGARTTWGTLVIDGGTVSVSQDANLGTSGTSVAFDHGSSSTLLDESKFSDSTRGVSFAGSVHKPDDSPVLLGSTNSGDVALPGDKRPAQTLSEKMALGLVGGAAGALPGGRANGHASSAEDDLRRTAMMLEKIKHENATDVSRLTVQDARAGESAPVTVAVNDSNSPAPEAARPVIAAPKIIRNGEIEFEVDNFDSAYDRIAKIAAEEGGAIASTDSQKLPNGKTRGTIVVRVVPDNLDRLVLKLRGLGELKNQHISAQDVTKQYTDVESQLRAARAMEERLLDMIKNAKGNVKDLLAAEKELANWRGFIEQYEGQLRYYNNLISLSTLSVTLYEKDMATPSAAVDAETISMGVETPDVTKSRTAALAAIDDVQGRVIVSQLKQYQAGQFAAVIVAEVPPASAGPLTDRLRQLGNVSRLDIDRKQTNADNAAVNPVLAALKVDRQPTRLELSLYNLADVAPRQTLVVSLACGEVETAYRAILAAADRPEQPGTSDGLPAVRIVSSSLNTQNPQLTSAVISMEARSDHAADIEKLVRAAGEVMKLTLSENADTVNVTRSKQGFNITLTPLAEVAPRESRTLQVAVRNVGSVYYRLLAFVQAHPDDGSAARVLSAQLSGDASATVGAALSFELPRLREIGLEAALAGQKDSDILTRSVTRAAGDTDTVDSKIRYDVSLIDAAKVAPRQTTTMAVEVPDVERALAAATQAVVSAHGTALDPRWARDQAGAASASVSLDVPVAEAGTVQDALERLGTVRVMQSVQAPQVPDGTLAGARFELTLGNAQQLVEPGEGLGSRFREGLRTSLGGLLWSFQWIVIGLLLLGPWAVLAWIARLLWRRGRRKATAA